MTGNQHKFEDLWEKLTTEDESVLIEAKTCADSVGESILETISAFANEPDRGGGYIILGVKKVDGEYQMLGVNNSDKIQCDLVNQCSDSFNLAIRPQLDIIRQNDKNLLLVFIPESQPQEKPIYIKKRGLPKGAFRRLGAADVKLTDQDLELFYQLRSHRHYDDSPIPEADLEDFDPAAIAEYRKRRGEINPGASELDFTDPDLLYSLAATTKYQGQIHPTIAGLILFGKSATLKRLFPMHRIDYIIVEGKEWVPDPNRRYQSIEILEPLLLAIPRLITLLLADIPKAFVMGENGIHRSELPLIPRNVIREAVVNALMHRNYRTRQPVQIIRFSNRIEIRNPGYSLKPIDSFSEPGSISRNGKIANVLHEASIAETKGTGFSAMNRAMQSANLTLPIFDSNQEKDEFVLKLLVHNLFSSEQIQWLSQFKEFNLHPDEAKALVILREIGEINNFVYRLINQVDPSAASQRLIHLRSIGLLQQQGKGVGTYYTLNPQYLEESDVLSYLGSTSLGNDPNLGSTSLGTEVNLRSNTLSREDFLTQMPQDLRAALEKSGKRADPKKVMELITSLCAWRELSSSDIAKILIRNQSYIVNRYLNPLIHSHSLEYTIPDNPNAPNQAYRSIENVIPPTDPT
jgi:ATP-dependent DNA helicase RecG